MTTFSSRFSDDFSVDERVAPLAELFRVLGDPTRLKIVLVCVTGRRAVGAIADVLGLSPSLVSHHLRRLRAARIVRAEREGKQVFYAAADAHIGTMLAGMLEHVAEAADDGKERGR
ncbi:metalloregulator ArsR/SmtB family transcription factor [Paraburkholderia sp. Ac-20347]|uniref:ArsR/SmtB family transcription factor n=1 Tax=Paraburkholderia sp. Ac-20347 TaxID=2703892 RepID=UPI001F128784|nr:metalloregulator ArsR/SmtB family transcription factor [Paraburkholderia sp. Ac-20347]